MEKFSDPEVFGPGTWMSIHTYALDATTPERKKEFAHYIRVITSNLKCDTCKMHATKYVQDHPPERFFNIKDEKSHAEIGCFKWSWIFHNDVNERIGKKKLDFNTALMMYVSSGNTCTDCGKSKEKEKGKESKKDVYRNNSTIISHIRH